MKPQMDTDGHRSKRILIGMRVKVPSHTAGWPRRRDRVVGRVIKTFSTLEGKLYQAWQIHHEPKEMAGWYWRSELEAA